MDDFNANDISFRPRAKAFCPICRKMPKETSTCPTCGIQGICSDHLYKLDVSMDSSRLGCPQCGPRCSICSAQAPLTRVDGRSVCLACESNIVESQKKVIKNYSKKIKAYLKAFLSLLFTLGGLFLGYSLGTKPVYQKMLAGMISQKMPPVVTMTIWIFIGLIIGSILSAILNSILKTET